ncbi:MAG: Panacea domain-containing protein [Patescibacteria group bacterium]
MRINKNKLRNLILYIFQKYNNDKLTETKLQKLLYFCDFRYFQKTNQAITGFTYRKNNYGPTIMELPKILKEMEREGLITCLISSNYYGAIQKNFAIANPDIKPSEHFSESELLTINTINEAYKGLYPREISEISHSDFPYLATKNTGEIIDYDLAHYIEDQEDDLDLENPEATKLFGSNQFAELMNRVDIKLSRDGRTKPKTLRQ